MNKANLFLIVGLAAGTGLGFVASGSLSGFGSGAAHTPMQNVSDAAHNHDRVQELSADEAPTVQIIVKPEGGCAYNLHIITQKFQFAPENVNGAYAPGEGHAHIYVDDIKRARVYSEWFHFTAKPSAKTVKVTLNSNDHATLASGGVPIEATAELTDC